MVRHYGSASERPLLDDLLITFLLMLAVATVVALGGRVVVALALGDFPQQHEVVLGQ